MASRSVLNQQDPFGGALNPTWDDPNFLNFPAPAVGAAGSAPPILTLPTLAVDPVGTNISSASSAAVSDSGAASNITFNNTYGSGVTPAYQNCILAAEQAIQSLWTAPTPITINLDFTGSAQGQNGELASNSFYTVGVSYATLKSALASHENSTYAQQAVAALPTSDPTNGAGFQLPEAYAQMLGLTNSNLADTVTLNTSYNWSYGQDVINTLEHEISEGGMGRIGGLGDQNSFWSTMDLFRYNASGAPDYTDGRDGLTTYFSYNGGKTLSSLSFNNEYSSNKMVNGGDTADFAQQDVFGTGSPGETNTLSQTDIQIMDALGWEPIGTTVIESHGSTSLVQVGNNYYLDSNTTGTGPELQLGGAAVVAGQNGAWTPIGAEQTSSGYEIAWKLPGANQYVIWNTDSNGNFASHGAVLSATSITLELAEVSFQQDLNGDGVIGLPANTAVIESYGSTSLVQVGNDYYLDSNTTGTGPELQLGGAAVVAGQNGAWTPIGAEQTSSGYEIAWKLPSTNQYVIWNTDSSGNFISHGAVLAANSTALESAEISFQQDLNGDGVIGIPTTTVIESYGSTSLVQIGNDYYLESNTTGTGPELQAGGAAVVVGQNGAWTPIGAEQTSSGYEIAWKLPSANQYVIWNTDSSGNFISHGAVLAANSTTLESAEVSFQQDLNGDGVIGIPGSSAAIDAGTTPAVAAANSGSIETGDSSAALPQNGGHDGNSLSGILSATSGQDSNGWHFIADTDQSTTASALPNVSALEFSGTSVDEDLNGGGAIAVPSSAPTINNGTAPTFADANSGSLKVGVSTEALPQNGGHDGSLSGIWSATSGQDSNGWHFDFTAHSDNGSTVEPAAPWHDAQGGQQQPAFTSANSDHETLLHHDSTALPNAFFADLHAGHFFSH
jgi:serralysin